MLKLKCLGLEIFATRGVVKPKIGNDQLGVADESNW